MSKWAPPTQAATENYFTFLNNWGRWGADSEQGALNLMTPAGTR